MALGILMLVLGLTLHGFDGDKTFVKEIELQREQVAVWAQQMQSEKEEYLEVKMRVKEETKPLSKVDPG
jgi:hypothetical protein